MNNVSVAQPAISTDVSPKARSAEQLSIALQRANEAFASLVDGLTEAQWTTRAVNTPGKASDEDEQRPVGTIVHHVALAHAAFLGRIRGAAEGGPPAIRTATLAEINAAHAVKNPNPDRVQTAALLRTNGAAIVDYVARLSEEQLKRETDFGGHRVTTAQIIGIVVGHIHDHELSIRSAVGKRMRLVRKGEGQLFDWGTMNLVMPVSATDSEARLSLFVGTIDPGAGNTVMHRHREHEVFYVLEGSFAIDEVRDGRVVTLTAGPGDLVDVPSWEPHSWSARGTGPGKLLALVLPGGIETLLGEILALDAAEPRPGPEAYAAAWRRHGHEVVEVVE